MRISGDRAEEVVPGLVPVPGPSTLDVVPEGSSLNSVWRGARARVWHCFRWALAVLIYHGGGLAAYRLWRRRRLPHGELRILRYHRVIPDQDAETVYPLGVRARSFAGQMRSLSRRYRTVDEHGVAEFLGGRAAGPGLRVLVTLDDGYRDNLTEGLPLLQEYGIPAVVFVATGLVASGTRFPWERLKRIVEGPRGFLPIPGGGTIPLRGARSRRAAFRRLHRWIEALPSGEREAVLRLWESHSEDDPRNDGPLSWEEVRRLSEAGVCIGSHTVQHLRLSRLNDDQMRDELEQSRARLEEVLGRRVDTLAFPSGDYDQRVLRATRAAGYRWAFTTNAGSNVPGASPLELRRKGMGEMTAQTPWGTFSPSLFAVELEGVYDHVFRRVFP